MENTDKRLYEGMFLVESGEAASDWDGVNQAIKTILDRAGAEIVTMRKWDERRLAYDINGKSKGTYILCYFKAEGDKIGGIERDVQLSERIMRVLILSTEGRSKQVIERDIRGAEATAETQQQQAVGVAAEKADESSGPASEEVEQTDSESD